MKNILLLGNGFDMYYKLPTKYVNFLHVVNYLLDNRSEKFETIADVFSQKSLQETDPFIAKCYDTHKQIFDTVLLEGDDISEIIKLTEKNLWFSYFNKVFNKDVGWIDFEKEISFVLKCFKRAFEKSTTIHFTTEEKHIQYVIELFKFYIDKVASQKVVTIGTYKVNTEYCIESPQGSGHDIINTEKVIETLYIELYNFSQALKLYLKCFVENAYGLLKSNGTCSRIDIFSHIEKVITFNYTNTYENFYYNNSVFHIHGDLSNEVVLGVNPDEADCLDNVNTTFVCFKKYFQRTLFETDKEYLRWFDEIVENQTSYRVFTMGHSLDITDTDIISELFYNAKEIIVLYHDFEEKKSYIANLVKMFGKRDFDMFKKEKRLTFISLNQDVSSLKAFLSEESWKDISVMINSEQGEKISII